MGTTTVEKAVIQLFNLDIGAESVDLRSGPGRHLGRV